MKGNILGFDHPADGGVNPGILDCFQGRSIGQLGRLPLQLIAAGIFPTCWLL